MAASMNWKNSSLFTIILSLILYLSRIEPFECVRSEEDKLVLDFNAFIQKFNKSYSYGTTEYWHRLAVFKANVIRQRKLNFLRARGHNESAIYGITKFSDLTPEEFRESYLSRQPTAVAQPFSRQGTSLRFKSFKWKPSERGQFINMIPKKFDWRDYNAVTPVKNQLHCGGCWAFSSVESIETMYYKKTHELRELAVQQVIDCDGNGNGCQGGDICSALTWMKNARTTLVTEAQYPLTDESNYCKVFPIGTKGVQINDSTCNSYVGQEKEMLNLIVNHGPLTVSVDATTWNDYLGGIIMYHCPDHNNHAVQIVGYDLTGDVPHFIVRNSWGEDFGNNGYVYIKIGHNMCGIAERVATVVL